MRLLISAARCRAVAPVNCAARLIVTLFAFRQLLGQLLVFALQLLDPGDRSLNPLVQLLEDVKSPYPLISTFTLNFD